MVEKGVFWSVLIKKQCYWPKGVPTEEIIRHMQNKEVGDVYSFQGSMRWNRYHIIYIKDPDYVVVMMRTYGTLEHLEGLDTQRRYKGAGWELVTKQFNNREVFGNHFNYRHKVDDKKNRRNSPITIDSTWTKNYWNGRCHAYFLPLTNQIAYGGTCST